MRSFFCYYKLGVVNHLNITFNLRSIIKISYKGLPAQNSHWVFINILGLMLGNNANLDAAEKFLILEVQVSYLLFLWSSFKRFIFEEA